MRARLTPRTFMILIACAGLLMVGGFILVIRRQQEAENITPAGNYLLTALSLVNLLLMMVLLFVLFRELVKGFIAWRRQREGARFRTRLLTAFVLLGLLPSLLLFVSAILLIESTVDRWFRSPVGTVASASQELVDKTLDMVRDESYRKAKALAWQLKKISPELRPALTSHLWQAGDMDAVALINRDGTVLTKMPPEFPAPTAYKVDKIFQPGGLLGWIDLTPVPTVVSGVEVDDHTGIMVGMFLPKGLFAQAKLISDNNKQYLQIHSQRQTLKISMISSFLALTLLVTFVAVWIGSQLFREVSVPLQLLLEGTQEVSRGNLLHRISYDGRDEIGQVVSSFNQMTQELEASKAELERSNAEIRAASESAERGRRYIETLLETLNIGVISTDADGQLRTLNPKARDILDMHPGEPMRNLVSRPEWGPIGSVIAGAAKRSVANREVMLNTRRGHVILSVTVTPLKGPDGKVFGSLIILEDISDLARAQRIAAWQEAAQRMAHEIKNPLTPIRLSAQRIRKKVRESASDLESAVMEGTTTIEREVEAMMTIVNEFSRFARLPEVHPKAASLPALIQATVASYRAASSTVDFRLDLPSDFPPVRLDMEQMGRVFKNLFENAIQAMDTSGQLFVGLREEAGQAVVTLRDTGPGIPPEARSRLFLPYFSTKRKGTGLGLAIVARILEEHGGTIRVDEEYRDGAGFIVTLPI
jgi:two-component system nitrogen regulation sensor histidine kinase NtrY